MRILLILIFLCSTANAALTPNKLPRTKTGGSAPTLQDSQILDDGTNVGIGTTTPQGGLIVTNGNVGIGTWAPLGLFQVNSATNSPFIVNNAGNLGIGTVNPISMLQVFKATNPATLSLTSNPASTTIINLGDTTNPTIGQVAYTNASDSMYFVVNGAEMMRVSSTGNVGIGTNSLIRGKLHIFDNSHSWYQNLATWGYKYSNESNDRINISSTGSDPRHAYIGFATGNASLTNSGVVFAKRNATGSIGVASIQTSDGSSLVERMVIDGAGNVGIATFSPTSLFEITSTVSRDLFRVNDNGNGDTSPFVIDSTGNVGIGTIAPVAELEVTQTDALDAFRVNDQATDTTPFVIDSTGNVGIGTTLPTNRFVIDNNYVQIDANGRMKLARNISTTPATAQIDFTNSVGFTSASNVYGINGEVSNSGSGNVIGYNATAGSSVTGTVSELRGIAAGVRTLAAGTNITTASMIYANTPAITAGTIGTQRGVYIADQEVSGVTTGYGVYQEASDNDNYFAGNVGIGSVTPSSILDIDIGTGVGQVTINGSTGGCLMIRDTDDAGWTECDVLDGVMTCSIDADGICD